MSLVVHTLNRPERWGGQKNWNSLIQTWAMRWQKKCSWRKQMDTQTDFSIVCQVLEITKLQHCLCGGVAGNLLRVLIFHYHICRHENVEPWPYAHKNIHHANEATKVPLQKGKTIPWNIRGYLQHTSSVNEPYAHDNIQKATEATKVAVQQVSVYQTHIVIDEGTNASKNDHMA